MKGKEWIDKAWKNRVVVLLGIAILVGALIPVCYEKPRPFFDALSGLSALVLLIVLFRQTIIMNKQSEIAKLQYKLQEDLYRPRLTAYVKGAYVYLSTDLKFILHLTLSVFNPTLVKNRFYITANTVHEYKHQIPVFYMKPKYVRGEEEIEPGAFRDIEHDYILVGNFSTLIGDVHENVEKGRKAISVTLIDIFGNQHPSEPLIITDVPTKSSLDSSK